MPFKGGGDIEYHHVKEAFLGGDNSPDNVAVLCRKCHAERTKEQRPMVDKVRRLYLRNIGHRRKVSKPMPGSRASGIRKRMNGHVERW
jgi:5-methylcytosine-specific restriction endonuclease McrA